MKTLQEALDEDEQMMREARADVLPPEYYRETLEAAVPVLRQNNLLDMGILPVTPVNKPWLKKSRRLKVIDIGSAQHGESGIGGTFDRVDIDPEEEIVYRFWHNIEIQDIDQQAYENPDGSSLDFDLFRESGEAAGEVIRELMNKALASELGKFKGIAKTTGRQTYAAAATWATAGQAKKDVVKAVIEKFPLKKIPTGNVALGVHPTDALNFYTHFSSTSTEQISQVEKFLKGGIFVHEEFPTGKAQFWAKEKTCLEVREIEPARVIPLPAQDEHKRMRIRRSIAFHRKKTDAILEVTGVA